MVLDRAAVVGGMAASFEVAGPARRPRQPPPPPRHRPGDPRRAAGAARRRPPAPAPPRSAAPRRPLARRSRCGPTDLVRHLPPRLAAGDGGRHACWRPSRRAGPDATFPEIVTAGLGPTVADHFYLPYARKLFGVDPAELDGELARRRVSGRRRRPSCAGWRPGRQHAPAPSTTRGGASARSPTRWPTPPPRPVSASGSRSTLRAVELAPRRRHGAPRRRHARSNGGRLWSTIPTGALAALATPAPPADVLAAAGPRATGPWCSCTSSLDRPRYTEFDAHYLPDAGPPGVAAVGAEELPRRPRPGRPHRAVRRGAVRRRRRDVDGVRRRRSAALVADALGAEGLPAVPLPSRSWCAGCPTSTPSTGAAGRRTRTRLEAWAASHERLLDARPPGAVRPRQHPPRPGHGVGGGGVPRRPTAAFDHDRWRGRPATRLPLPRRRRLTRRCRRHAAAGPPARAAQPASLTAG